jgi:hypothetical protein
VLSPINTKINTPISVFNAPGHDRSSKFRIYKTSRAHNSETFLSSETHDFFVVQKAYGFVASKRFAYNLSRTEI